MNFDNIYTYFAILFLNHTTVWTLRLYGHLELHFGNTHVKEKYLHKNMM